MSHPHSNFALIPTTPVTVSHPHSNFALPLSHFTASEEHIITLDAEIKENISLSCHTCHSEPPRLKLCSYPHYTYYTYYSEPSPLKLCPHTPTKKINPCPFLSTYSQILSDPSAELQ